jgi:ECF transporter S component (folate family)
MERYIKTLKHNWLLICLIFIVFFLLTFFLSSFVYNNNFSYYQIEVKSNYDINNLFSETYFRNTMDKIAEHNLGLEQSEKITYSNIEYQAMLEDIKITNDGDVYTIKIKSKYFTTTASKKSGQVDLGTDRCIKYLDTLFNFNNVYLDYTNENKIEIIGSINPYPISIIVASTTTLASIILLLVYTKKNKELEFNDISNNETIFKHPFNKKYWNYSKTCFTKVKNLTNISILFALLLIGKMIALPSGFGALGISFTFIIFSIITMLYGPICGLTIGFFSDVLGHVLFQSSTQFFFGYTINAMLAGLIYGLLFYRTKVTFTKCLASRILVNTIINVFLGTIWWKMLYGLSYEATITYLLTISIPKNIIYLLPQSIILYIIIKALAGPFKMFNLIEEEIADNITLW